MIKTYYKKIILTILSLILLLSFLCLIGNTSLVFEASTDSDIANYQKQIKDMDKQLDSLNNQLENIKSLQNQTVLEKTLLENVLQATNERLAALNSVLYDLEIDLAEKKAELDKTQSELDNSIEQFRKRARASYEAGQVSYLEILLTSSSMEDMLIKYDLMTEVAENDKNLINNVKNQYNTIKVLYDEINQKTQAQQNAVNEIASTQRTQQNKMYEYENLLSTYDANSESIQKQSEAIHAEQDEIDRKLAKLIAEQSTTKYYGDELCWPVPSSGYISSGYGYRTFDHSFHNAIDIAAGLGSNVVAAADGVIKSAKWVTTGGGNQIMLDHGSGLVTVYNHLNGFAVSAGQSVKKGQVIGYVGSTGNSSGPHLDFKIIYNGATKNPADYVCYGGGKPPKSIHSLIG